MSHLRYVAIDETDRMVESGHFEELESILQKVKGARVEKRQVRAYSNPP